MTDPRNLRFSPEHVFCDEEGPRIGNVPLLVRDSTGLWQPRSGAQLEEELGRLYGFPIDMTRKQGYLKAAANALMTKNLPLAQMATLLMRLPDPPGLAKSADRSALCEALLDSNMLKVDWNPDLHPRTGTPPNPGWFAPVNGGASLFSTGRGLGPLADLGAMFFSPRGRGASWLAAAVVGSEETASLISPPTAAAAVAYGGYWFVRTHPGVLDGVLRPASSGDVFFNNDMKYSLSHSLSSLTITGKVNGQWQTIVQGTRHNNGIYYTDQNDGFAMVSDKTNPDGSHTLTLDPFKLTRALAAARGEAVPATTTEDEQPRLCPNPTPESVGKTSKNSIAYQEHISGIPYGMAININNVNFDGCDPKTGILLEAKAKYDNFFDKNNMPKSFWLPTGGADMMNQFINQGQAAKDTGRIVLWCVQTEKSYEGIKNFYANFVPAKNKFGNIFIEYCPYPVIKD